MLKISKKEARKYLLRYQNIYNPRQLESDEEIVDFIRKIGCIQYDPLNTVAKNADLVLQSRCKNYSESVLLRLLYEKRKLVDGWDKNMSIWAVSDWPYFSRKRNAYIDRYQKRADEFSVTKGRVADEIEKKGYVSSKEVFGDRKVPWSWAPTDIGRATLEAMYHCGDLVIHHKEGTRKYYGFAKELLPASIADKSDQHTTLADYHDWYVKRRVGALGLLWNKSGDAWLGTDLKKEERSLALQRLLDKDELTEVKVSGSDEIFYLPQEGLKLLEDNETYNEASMIAPLDNLMWDRKLITAIFDFDYKWEVYTPVKKRKFGYFVLPVISGDEFIGRCEPVVDRMKNELVMRNWWWEDGAEVTQDVADALTRCLKDFSAFLGVEAIRLDSSISAHRLEWIADCL